MSNTGIIDIHSKLFRSSFAEALPFDDFVSKGQPAHQERWKSCLAALAPSPSQITLIESFTREMNLLVLAGMWCGDCARQCPIIECLARCSPKIRVRYIDNQHDATLRDELRIHGASRVPVVVTLSEDFLEVQRFGDRTLSAYGRKAERELGDACDSGIGLPPAEELAEELREWVAILERQQLLLRLSPMLRKRHGD